MKLIKFVLALGIIAALGFTALTGYGMVKADESLPVCNLNDYVVTTQSGKNGEGNLSMSLDTERIIADYGQYLENHSIKTAPEWLQKLASPFISEGAIRDCLNGVVNTDSFDMKAFSLMLSKDAGLSNGDEVIVQWDDTPASIGALKLVLPVRFEYSPFSYTVDNLTAVETLAEASAS